jgi:hypothetical protein
LDPFDEMTDSEFERHVLESLDRGTTKISLRVPNDLLGRTRQAAGRRGVPYQSLIKVLLEQGVTRLERVLVPRTLKRRRRIAGKRVQRVANSETARVPRRRRRRQA